MDYRPAEFVRVIDPAESLDDLVNEAKADTWSKEREHAVIMLDDGMLAMIRGGRDGIVLMDRGEAGVFVQIETRECRVVRLAWHTHPLPTGPSDHDRAILTRLGQESSVVFEIRGDPAGTRFTAKAG